MKKEKIYKRSELKMPKPHKLTAKEKKNIEETVDQIFAEYGECLKKLGED